MLQYPDLQHGLLCEHLSPLDVEGKSIAKNILKDICYQGNDVFGKFFFAKGFYVQTWNKLYRLSMLRAWEVECIPSNVNEDVFFTFQLFKPIQIRPHNAIKRLLIYSPYIFNRI